MVDPADTTKANIEATGLQKDFFKVGKQIKLKNEDWTINTVVRPTAPSGDDIDERTIKIHHTHAFKVPRKIDGTGTVASSPVITFQLYL